MSGTGSLAILRFSRPYRGEPLKPEDTLGPEDAFLGQRHSEGDAYLDRADVVRRDLESQACSMSLLPYPRSGRSEKDGIAGVPKLPKQGERAISDADKHAHVVLFHMNQTVARILDLEDAVKEQERVLEHLATAWECADEDDPKKAEIVRQAEALPKTLSLLERNYRRVLKREQALVPLVQVQQMDRKSMLWVAKQAGSTTLERAGSTQRVMAIVKREHLDTLENRVLNSYAMMAIAAAREWLNQHQRIANSERYLCVQRYVKSCRRVSASLKAVGVGMADPNVAPNYVLQQNQHYRKIWDAWILLRQSFAKEDAMWVWQGNTWVDFCQLLLQITLHQREDAELTSHAPIVWNSGMEKGRWFRQDNPIAVFWLRNRDLVVELDARPSNATDLEWSARASMWLRVTNLVTGSRVANVPVWTPHMISYPDPGVEARIAVNHLAQLRDGNAEHALHRGIVLLPSNADAVPHVAMVGSCVVHTLPICVADEGLRLGQSRMAAVIDELIEQGGL